MPMCATSPEYRSGWLKRSERRQIPVSRRLRHPTKRPDGCKRNPLQAFPPGAQRVPESLGFSRSLSLDRPRLTASRVSPGHHGRPSRSPTLRLDHRRAARALADTLSAAEFGTSAYEIAPVPRTRLREISDSITPG